MNVNVSRDRKAESAPKCNEKKKKEVVGHHVQNGTLK